MLAHHRAATGGAVHRRDAIQMRSARLTTPQVPRRRPMMVVAAAGANAPQHTETAATAVPEVTVDAQQAYAAYQQQAGVPQQYYAPVPPPPPVYPAAAYGAAPAAAAAGGVPWWVWMGAGIVVAKVMDFVQNLVKKGPQAMMAEMAMKQMMKGMSMPPGAAGGPAGSPFGAAAAGGVPNFGPYGAANPFAPNFKPPAVDTTATTVKEGGADSASSRGEKFAARAAGGSAAATAAAAASDAKPASSADDKKADGAAAKGAAAAANGAGGAAPVVEAAEVKEPGASTSGSASSSSGGDAAAAFFTDVGGGGAGGGNSTADVGQMTAMMEQMLRDPNMQKMLYPYLPEPMRNPESIEWMLNTPEVRKQLEQTLANSGMTMSPQMMQMMQQMDFSQEKVQQQFGELGLKPEDVISKVLANPELASGFSNPKVQAAIFDISQNPMNVMKYQEDPEVMKVLEKVTELFSPQQQAQAQQK